MSDPVTIGAVVISVGKFISSLFSKASSAISAAISSANIAALIGTVSAIITTITDVVGGFAGLIGTVIGPILNVVESVNTLAASIETNIIGPIVRPIISSIHNTENLVKTIDRLVDQGLSGLIEIPKAITDALTGIEATWARSTIALAKANSEIVTRDLVPPMVSAIAPGFESIKTQLFTSASTLGLNPDQSTRIPINEALMDVFKGEPWASLHNMVQHPDGFWELCVWVLVSGLQFVYAGASSAIALIEEGEIQSRFANPTKILGPSEVLAMYERGILNSNDAFRELKRNGLNDDRSVALRELSRPLPSPNEALTWWLKGFIKETERDDIMRKNGWNDEVIKLSVLTAQPALGEQTLLDWLARELITRDTFDAGMRGKGYNVGTTARILKDALDEPQINTTINWWWSRVAAQGDWFASTYASLPPTEVITAGRRTRVDPTETLRRWQSQFAAMPVGTAIELFFRGEINRAQVEIVVQQNGYPKDMTALLIKAQSPLLPTRSIPGLVAKGSITVAEGMERLKERGFTLEDSTILLTAATEELANALNADPTEQTKITASQARDAYRDGVIDEVTVRGILAAIHLSDADIEFMLALDNFNIANKLRKDEIDTIKAEVSLGILTVDDAGQALFTLGLTDPEVLRVVATLKQTQRQNAKLPDLSLLTRMAKASLIKQTEYLSGLRALGYSAPWDELIVDLTFKPGVPSA